MTHLLKLLDNMCKYEMDPTNIVEDTERTQFCPQTDRRTRWNQYTPLPTSLKRGYNKTTCISNHIHNQMWVLPFGQVDAIMPSLIIHSAINQTTCHIAAPMKGHRQMVDWLIAILLWTRACFNASMGRHVTRRLGKRGTRLVFGISEN